MSPPLLYLSRASTRRTVSISSSSWLPTRSATVMSSDGFEHAGRTKCPLNIGADLPSGVPVNAVRRDWRPDD